MAPVGLHPSIPLEGWQKTRYGPGRVKPSRGGIHSPDVSPGYEEFKKRVPSGMAPVLTHTLRALRSNTARTAGLARDDYAGFCSSFATLSSTPLTNCTDSRLENFRAISSDSLITTARGVSG